MACEMLDEKREMRDVRCRFLKCDYEAEVRGIGSRETYLRMKPTSLLFQIVKARLAT